MDSLSFLDRAGQGKPQPVYVLPGDETVPETAGCAGPAPMAAGRGRGQLRVQLLFRRNRRLGVDPRRVANAPLPRQPTADPHRQCRPVRDSESPVPGAIRGSPGGQRGAGPGREALALDDPPGQADRRERDDSLQRAEASPVAEMVRELVPGPARQTTGARMRPRCLWSWSAHEMGLLDQDLAKLAVYVGEAGTIQAEDVDRLVGNSRAEEVWKIFGMIAAGRPGDALSLSGTPVRPGQSAGGGPRGVQLSDSAAGPGGSAAGAGQAAGGGPGRGRAPRPGKPGRRRR